MDAGEVGGQRAMRVGEARRAPRRRSSSRPAGSWTSIQRQPASARREDVGRTASGGRSLDRGPWTTALTRRAVRGRGVASTSPQPAVGQRLQAVLGLEREDPSSMASGVASSGSGGRGRAPSRRGEHGRRRSADARASGRRRTARRRRRTIDHDAEPPTKGTTIGTFATWRGRPRSTALPQRRHASGRGSAARGARATGRRRGRRGAPRCRCRSTAKPKAMLMRMSIPSWPTSARLWRSTGWWTPAGREQEPEQPEDRPRRADRRHVATEHEAGDRPGRRAGQVEEQEPDGAVPALDDRPGEVQRVHVEEQVERGCRGAA